MLSKILFGALVSLELASRSGWIVLLPRGNVAPPLDGGDRLDGTGDRERESVCVFLACFIQWNDGREIAVYFYMFD